MLGLELLCWIQVGPCWIRVGATWSSVGDHVGSCSVKKALPSKLRVECLTCNRPMLDASRGPVEPSWGHEEDLTQETLSPVAGKVAARSLRSFFFKALLLPGAGIAKMPPEEAYVGPSWGYVGPSGVYVGAMFAHLGAMLGLC